jgi:hypothetical protein
MNMEFRMRLRKIPDPILWGQITAIGMGAFVTIVCVVQSVDPIVILKRAVISSLATGATCAATVFFITRVHHATR